MTNKMSLENYKEYFKETGEVRVPKYGEYFLDLDVGASQNVVYVFAKEPYSGMWEIKNPYIILEEIVEVLTPPSNTDFILFKTKDGVVHSGYFGVGSYFSNIKNAYIAKELVVDWKYVKDIFEEEINNKIGDK